MFQMYFGSQCAFGSQARARRDYKTADVLRDQLEKHGVYLDSKAHGGEVTAVRGGRGGRWGWGALRP